MRTEWYVGIGFDYKGEPMPEAELLCEKAYLCTAEVFGGYSAHRAVGGEAGKPSEPSLVIVSDCPSKDAAEWHAVYLAHLFAQRAVFGFFGSESFLREVTRESEVVCEA